MNAILPWLIVFGGPILGAIAGATGMHFNERIHWHRLAQTWYDDGYDAGWHGARQAYGTMVPDMMFTQAGTLEALPPADSGLLAEASNGDRPRCDARTATDTLAVCYDPAMCDERGACLKFNPDGTIRTDVTEPVWVAKTLGIRPRYTGADQDPWDTITINLAEHFHDIRAGLYLP